MLIINGLHTGAPEQDDGWEPPAGYFHTREVVLSGFVHTIYAQKVRYVGESVSGVRCKQRGRMVAGYTLALPRDYVHRSKPHRVMNYRIQLHLQSKGRYLFCP